MILLVKPEPAHNPFSLDMALKNEPLELEYIMAMLKERGYEVFLYDAGVDRTPYKQILSEQKPHMVVITGYITQEYLMKEYARAAKAMDAGTVTVIGGLHAQLNYTSFMVEEVDYICRSDNIFVLGDLAGHAVDGKLLNKEGDGLCYQEKGAWQVNELRPFDPNLLPIPDRSHFYKHRDKYRYLDVHPVALLKASTSCPYDCSFCYGTALNCGKHFYRDLDKVIEEIKGIDCPNIQIVDDDFLTDKARLRDFLDLLRAQGIKKTFICYGRADFIVREKELMVELVAAGFRYFMVGLEAVSDQTLAGYNKKTTMDMNRTCVEVVHSLGAVIVGLFIIDIGFRRQDFRDMRRWIKEMGISYTGISIFTPIPGTRLYEEYRDRLTTRDMEKWDFMHLVTKPLHMSRFAFYLEYFLLAMDLLRVAQKAGIYSFLRLNDYKSVFLRLLFTEGLKRDKKYWQSQKKEGAETL